MKLLLSLLVLITVFAVGLFTGRNTVTPRNGAAWAGKSWWRPFFGRAWRKQVWIYWD